MATLKYKPDGQVLKDFMKGEAFVRGLRGPVGSGKSVACCIEMFRRSLQQAKAPDGKRYTKWSVVRNTNPMLRTTTIATWLSWFPENEWGAFRWSPPFTHHIKKGDIDMEVIFLALDRPEDVKKLLSLELTGVWINEARELSKSIVDACTMRVGRYPSMKDGGPSWSGVIMDTNAPEEDHWWPIMAGDVPPPDYMTPEETLMLVKPDNWKFYVQPAGMEEEKEADGSITGYKLSTERENGLNIMAEYYPNLIQGKTKSWIDVYVMNRLGSIDDGKPVYGGFTEKTHVSKENIEPLTGVPIVIGLDFGLTPAAAFCQRLPTGRWLLLHELVCQDMGAIRFAEQLRREMAGKYPGFSFEIYGDPAGDFRAQTDENTPFQILRGAGLVARPAPSNDPVLRVEAVNSVLSRMVNGEPGLLVDRRCSTLVKGFAGGYQYKRLNVSGERYDERPCKNRYSHVHDALQYALMGAGEGRAITRGSAPVNPSIAGRSWSVWDRGGQQKERGSLWDRIAGRN